MTVGVRVLAENPDGDVLLVRHTYVPGWYFPGGGVETGEHALQAVQKELHEETGLSADDGYELLGVFWNKQASKRDHVLFYRCKTSGNISNFTPNSEIAEIGFFSQGNIPADTTKATLRRLDEVYQGREQSTYW
ncbi:MAG: NUDIX domain-containing protein [Pseudomonadota bacterium]